MTPSYTPPFNLTQEQFSRFSSACHRTLGYIAEALPGNASQNEVIETVLDADRVLTHGASSKDDPKEWETFYKTVISPILSNHYSSPQFKAMMKKIIPKNCL
jgi:hypothetical protein